MDRLLIRAAGNCVSRWGRSARLSILIYHRVRGVTDPVWPQDVDVSAFERHMALVSRYFNALPLSEAVLRLRSGSLPARALAVTFDDGYADNVEVALPVLQRWHVPASFFIATGFLNGGIMWNDAVIEAVRRAGSGELDLERHGLGRHRVESVDERRAAVRALLNQLKYMESGERSERVAQVVEACRARLPVDLMMSSAQVRSLREAGMEIGAHTVNHPILTRITRRAALNEIADSRQELEGMLGERVNFFAYPNGKPGVDYSRDHVRIVRRLGFEGAVSTQWGAASAGDDIYQLPRFTPWSAARNRFLLLMWRNMLRGQSGVRLEPGAPVVESGHRPG